MKLSRQTRSSSAARWLMSALKRLVKRPFVSRRSSPRTTMSPIALVGRWLGRAVRWSVMTAGILSIFSILTVGFLVLSDRLTTPTLHPDTVLTLNLGGFYADHDVGGGYRRFLRHPSQSLSDTLAVLERAERDDRVIGLVARLDDFSMGVANLQELRAALIRFSRAGKFTLVFADSLDATKSYYLASAFDHIWLQPMGDVTFNGLFVEKPFFRNALDLLSIEPTILKRKEYKTGADMFMESDFTPEGRAAEEALLTSLMGQMAHDIAQQRDTTPEAIMAWVKRGVFRDKQALTENLVDRLASLTDVKPAILEYVRSREAEAETSSAPTATSDVSVPAEEDAEETSTEATDDEIDDATDEEAKKIFLSFDGYARATENDEDERYDDHENRVALIFARGDIVRDGGRSDVLDEDGAIGGYNTSALIMKAARDETVKSIVLRMDTGGGSVVASETIRQAVLAARRRKPVVVSMSNVVASGGYWIASAANKIVAMPGTITGSIGVFGGKFVTAKLWERLGVHWRSVAVGEHAAMNSSQRPYTPEELALVNESLDSIYQSFVERVAGDRQLDPAHVDACARGRVWTGADAKNLGLVDVLGGLDVALNLARDLGECERATVVVYPERKRFYDDIVSLAMGPEHEEPLLQGRVDGLGGAWLSFSRTLLSIVQRFLAITTAQPLKNPTTIPFETTP